MNADPGRWLRRAGSLSIPAGLALCVCERMGVTAARPGTSTSYRLGSGVRWPWLYERWRETDAWVGSHA